MSNIVAWLIAVTGSYAMNSKITFRRETGGVLNLGQYLRFASSGILGLTVATTVLVVLSQYSNVPSAKLASISRRSEQIFVSHISSCSRTLNLK
ncbi:GtrA family protein [Bradyrhizobium sp. 171]|nr:GtrA family protein [Bradyrhizobium sp. 176]MCK1562401.1 GtrA family protein [Bradyrhizobium sp. 171]UPJ98300.1 GtrA family protein [Bradyrhizobium sp. 172]